MTVAATAGSFRAAGYERAKGDLYQTPEWCTNTLLQYVAPLNPIREPHAGRGGIVTPLVAAGHRVVASDLYDWGGGFESGVDFLAETDLRGCNSVVMNPPYGTAAEKHVRHALNLLPDDGSVYALLRWNWIAAKGRVGLLRHLNIALILGRVNMPPDGAPDKGHTATTDYAWFIFRKRRADATLIVRAL